MKKLFALFLLAFALGCNAATSSIQLKRDTAANWTTSNRVLLAGEQGLETDTKLRKTGDGTTAWNVLPYDFVGSPVTLTGATNLTAAAHGNRQILYSTASNAPLAIQNDTLGGWQLDAFVSVYCTSTGLPTLSTPDGKSITAPDAQTPIGATRIGANAWNVYLLPRAAGGSSLTTFGAGTSQGVARPLQTNPTVSSWGVGSPTTNGTAQSRSTGTAAYQQLDRVGYLGTAGTASGGRYYTPLLFSLGAWRQRIVVMGAPRDTMGNVAPFLMGEASALAAFSTTTLQPANSGLGAIIGIGWSGDGTQSDVQLISSPSSGGGTYTDLGASFPIPTVAESVMYALQLDYYPSSDAGGRRVVWKLTELISGATTGGTITTNLIAQSTAQLYAAGVSRYTIGTSSGAPEVDFGGLYLGAPTQWAP